MCCLARPQAHTRGAAQRYGAEMPLEKCAFVHKMFLQEWLVIQRIHMQVLIICKDKKNVRLLLSLAGRWTAQWHLQLASRKAGKQRKRLKQLHVAAK